MQSRENKLDQKLEEILANSQGNEPVRLIVQVRSGGDETTAVMRSAYFGLRSRSVSVNPNDCLPPKRNELVDEYNNQSRTLTAEDWSFARRISQISPFDLHPRPYIETKAAEISADVARVANDLGILKTTVFGSASSFGAVFDREKLWKNRRVLSQFEGIFPDHRIPPPESSTAVRPLNQNTLIKSGASWGIESTKAVTAWGSFEEHRFGAKGHGVKVAVLDSGVDATHPDLVGKLAGWAEFDANGNPIVGSNPYDPSGHGTHVAGTIVGGKNSGHHIGMAPEARLLVARILDETNGGTLVQLLAGLEWALKCGADVINLSLGTINFEHEVTGYFEVVLARAIRAGVTVVAAIGNNGHHTSNNPANHLLAFSVGAHSIDHRCAAFSGGMTQIIRESKALEKAELPIDYSKPEISAPGIDIYSALPTNLGDKHGVRNGTSMATPHVSGAIAQLLSATDIKSLPGPLRSSVIRDLIIGSCVDKGEVGQDQRFGYGCLDIYQAIKKAHERDY